MAAKEKGLRGLCVLLECVTCERAGKENYRSRLRLLPDGSGSCVGVDTDCPLVPGTEYELLIKGLFPGYAQNIPCIGNVASFCADGRLEGLDLNDHKIKKYEESNK